MNGSRINTTVQSAFIQPEVSDRWNRSPKITLDSQNQMTQPKNTSIVQITSRNGYIACHLRSENSRTTRTKPWSTGGNTVASPGKGDLLGVLRTTAATIPVIRQFH